MIVNEIFFSIQGESTHAGRPCGFVRLAHCNLRCEWCDTEYAFEEGRKMALEEIVGELERYPTDLIEVTGGEPLLQSDVLKLITCLLDAQKTVLVETGGSLSVGQVDRRARLIYDIKCPGSGMSERNCWENLALLKDTDEIKFVVKSREDYEWARDRIREWDLTSRHTVLFSPVWERLKPSELAEWVLQDGLPVRVQVQLHKYLWGAAARGV